MIIGIGNDLCNISRIEKIISTNLNGLIRRLFSDKELFCFESKKFSNTTQKAAYIAKRFAAKEAIYKSLSKTDNEISLNEIEIINDVNNKNRPIVNILKPNITKLQQENKLIIDVSISHVKEYATATAISTLII